MTTNLAVYIKRPETIQRFQDILGRGANAYIQSVIIAAGSSEELTKCTEKSIVSAALRAASLGLSCDPAQREAHLVPRNRKVKGKNGQADSWVKEASFEVHYLGLYKLAIRTGKYWTINVIPILNNQEIRMGIDGLHYVYENGLKIDHFPVDRVTAKYLSNVKGWLGYFKTTRGFEKTAYMSVAEIMAHAEKYSQSYKRDVEKGTRVSLWSNPDSLPTMQMKTVLRDLLKWADTSGDAGAALQVALQASDEDTEEPLEAIAEEIGETDNLSVDAEYPPPARSEAENLSDLGFGEPASGAVLRPAEKTADYDPTEMVEILNSKTLARLVAMNLFEAPQAAAQVLSHLFPGTRKAPLGKLIERANVYRKNKEEIGDTERAIELTLATT